MEKIIKDEDYIKNLLANIFKDKGTFQQFEFSSWGMKHRPDFVILEPDKFTYFEIKSEYDSLARLENQIHESKYLFTNMFLVAPLKHIQKAKEQLPYFHYYCGAYALEDLEAGILEPMESQMLQGHVSIEAVAHILWSDELYNYIKNIDLSVNGSKWTKQMLKDNKHKIFQLVYSNSDSLKILNEILPNRDWNYRRVRESNKKRVLTT